MDINTSPLFGGVRDRFLERLKREVSIWVAQGIITQETSRRILDRYGEAYEEKIKVQRQGRLTQIIVTLGAILVGAGVLLYIGANWETMPKGLKLSLIFSSIALAYGLGVWLKRLEYEKTAAGLLFLGSLLYGAGLALVAQIYHIQAQSGTIFLLWGIGVGAVGLALRAEPFLSFSSILFSAWTILERFSNFRLFGGGRFIGTLHAWYLLPFAILMGASYWLKRGILLAFSLLGFFVWVGFVLNYWGAGLIPSTIFYLIFGIFLSVLAFIHIYILNVPRAFALPYSMLGTLAILITTYIFSFNSLLNQYHTLARLSSIDPIYWVVLGALSVLALLGSLGIGVLSKSITFIRYGFLALAGLIIFSLLFLFFPALEGPSGLSLFPFLAGVSRGAFNPYTLIWNILLAAETLGLIVLGYFTHDKRYVNIGIVFFILLVMSRYFDVFSLYFGTYASFIVGGLLFILLGFSLERFRRKLLQKMQEHTRSESEIPL